MQQRKYSSICIVSSLLLGAGVIYFIVRNKKKKVPPLEVVPFVDMQKYLGKWYDIAHLPAVFLKDCFNIQADYSLDADGTIKVVNTCSKNTVNGVQIQAVGKAWVVDTASNAKLKVEFFWPFKGDYWILDIGNEYGYALVGTPSRKYLWILGRNTYMEENTLKKLIDRANDLGFSTNQLIMTKHHVI